MKDVQIYLKGKNKAASIKSIRLVGDFYKVVYNNSKIVYTYHKRDVKIIESALKSPKSKDCFDYLKEIADAVGLTAEVTKGKIVNILSYNYSKIKFILPESMLGAFLFGELSEPKTSNPKIAYCGTFFREVYPPKPEIVNENIYPFGFNASQKTAVDKALTSKLSIIDVKPPIFGPKLKLVFDKANR